MVRSFLGQLEKYIKKIERLNQVDALRFLQAQRAYDIIFRRRVALATTCRLSILPLSCYCVVMLPSPIFKRERAKHAFKALLGCYLGCCVGCCLSCCLSSC